MATSLPHHNLGEHDAEVLQPNTPTTPRSIADLPYWGTWKREDGTKVPYNPVTGRRAKPNDAATFSTRAKAERALAKGTYEGLCILIDAALGVTMLDFDHVVTPEHAGDETQLPPDVRRVIRMANTHTTWSPSRTGIRMFCAATTGRDFENKNHGRKICIAEQYNAARFATIMMNAPISNTPDIFNDNRDDLVAVLEALDFKPRAAEQSERLQPPPSEWSGIGRTNEQVLETAFGAKNGNAIRRLYEGDTTGYPASQSDPGFSSEADFAFIGYLAGYVHSDDQLADLWRSSKLYRKKLDRNDYMKLTIDNIRKSQTWWWDSSYGERAPLPMIADRQPTGNQPDASEGDSCPAQLAVARRRIRELEATVATLQVRAKMSDEREAIYRNTKLGSARQTGAALASLFQSERPREPDSATPYRMPLAKLAERTGLSPDTCSKHLKQLATYRTDGGAPVLHAETREIPFSVDESTGEITTQHREVWIGPGVEPSAFGYILGALVPDAAPKHGGKPDRNVCPDHPLAGIIRRTKTTRRVTRECAQCHTPLATNDIEIGTPTREFIRAPKPIQHHAFRHESETEEPGSPMPQDAPSIDNHTVVNPLCGKMRHSYPPDTDAPPDGWALPYPGQAGHDRHTA
jgi:hypothetical protein